MGRPLSFNSSDRWSRPTNRETLRGSVDLLDLTEAMRIAGSRLVALADKVDHSSFRPAQSETVVTVARVSVGAIFDELSGKIGQLNLPANAVSQFEKDEADYGD